MNLLTQIALIAGVIAFFSLLWLVSRAFGKHPVWGFAVLFLSPVAAMLFGVRYWRDAKAPLLVHFTTLSIAATLGLYQFAAKGGWDQLRDALRMQQPAAIQSSGHAARMAFLPTSLNAGSKPAKPAGEGGLTTGTPPAPTQPARQDETVPARNLETQAKSGSGVPTVQSAKPIEPKTSYRAAYVSVDPSLAGDYVGMTVKVKRWNRPEQDCMLKRVSPTTLGFEQHTRGGTFSFEYRQGDIEKLRVLVKQAY